MEHNPYSLYAGHGNSALTSSHVNMDTNSNRPRQHSNSEVNRIANDLLKMTNLARDHDTSFFNYNDNMSEIESAIIRSAEPIEIDESEEITALGHRGIWANKSESVDWRGPYPLSKYEINNDPNPEIIYKQPKQEIEYMQELAIRYLRPPTPPAPGDIIIVQEENSHVPPAPPLIIRQQPARPVTPPPLIIREAPPTAPPQLGQKIITISGKHLPPPPRKVVIERLAPLPAKPQSVIIERWLPYSQVKRKVVFQNMSSDSEEAVEKPKNVIVQWETPNVKIKKEYKYLGVIRANPLEYVQRYGSNLKRTSDLPEFVHSIKNPAGIVLAANHSYTYELEGDLNALNLIDLEKEGLGMYSSYLRKSGALRTLPGVPPNFSHNLVDFTQNSLSQFHQHPQSNLRSFSAATSFAASSFVGSTMDSEIPPVQPDSSLAVTLDSSIEQIFRLVDRDNCGRINCEDAEKTLLRLNSRLKRQYGEDDVKAFFSALDANLDNTIDLNEFKKAFINIAIA